AEAVVLLPAHGRGDARLLLERGQVQLELDGRAVLEALFGDEVHPAEADVLRDALDAPPPVLQDDLEPAIVSFVDAASDGQDEDPFDRGSGQPPEARSACLSPGMARLSSVPPPKYVPYFVVGPERRSGPSRTTSITVGASTG